MIDSHYCFQLAWAPGKGMKDKQWRDYWDVDLGASYIPIDRLVRVALLIWLFLF